MTPLSLLQASLIGKKLKHRNRYGREVELIVESIKIEHHSVQITPDTRENDWWGESRDWDNFRITFVDGSSEEFSMGTEFEIKE
jgi:hypothetical protein